MEPPDLCKPTCTAAEVPRVFQATPRVTRSLATGSRNTACYECNSILLQSPSAGKEIRGKGCLNTPQRPVMSMASRHPLSKSFYLQEKKVEVALRTNGLSRSPLEALNLGGEINTNSVLPRESLECRAPGCIRCFLPARKRHRGGSRRLYDQPKTETSLTE